MPYGLSMKWRRAPHLVAAAGLCAALALSGCTGEAVPCLGPLDAHGPSARLSVQITSDPNGVGIIRACSAELAKCPATSPSPGNHLKDPFADMGATDARPDRRSITLETPGPTVRLDLYLRQELVGSTVEHINCTPRHERCVTTYTGSASVSR